MGSLTGLGGLSGAAGLFSVEYYERVLGYGPIAYWPLWEPAGLVANCLVNPAQDGAYTGVVLGQPGIGDGNTCPLFDGAADYVDVSSAALIAAFDGAEGTLLLPFKVSGAGVWTDSTVRYLLNLAVDANNFVRIYRTATNYQLKCEYGAGGVTRTITLAFDTTDWVFLTLSWSASADEFSVYVDGDLIATLDTLGVWAGNLATCVIGAQDAVGTASWSGYIQHVPIWDDGSLGVSIAADLGVLYSQMPETQLGVPTSELISLTQLYNWTAGVGWTNSTNWLAGNVATWFGVTVAGGHVTRVLLNTNNLVGSLAAWNPVSLPSLTRLYLHANTLVGDLSGWVLPAPMTQLYLNSNNFTGGLSGWVLPAPMTQLYLYNNNFTGDLSGWVLPAPMTHIHLGSNNFTGDLSGWVLPAPMIQLYLYNNNFTGDLSGWVLPAPMTHLYLYGNGFIGTPDVSANTAMRVYHYHNNGLDQANVDAVLLSVYNRRMAFTFATPDLNVGGTNLAPSGIYQAACPPGTGKEYAFELVNDSCGDGFNKWTVTFTP